MLSTNIPVWDRLTIDATARRSSQSEGEDRSKMLVRVHKYDSG